MVAQSMHVWCKLGHFLFFFGFAGSFDVTKCLQQIEIPKFTPYMRYREMSNHLYKNRGSGLTPYLEVKQRHVWKTCKKEGPGCGAERFYIDDGSGSEAALGRMCCTAVGSLLL